MANPGKLHWDAVKSIMRYLKGTKNKRLYYGKGPLELTGFCDSNMAGDVDTRKSTSGYVFTLAEGAVSWCSRLQKIVALSTTEAEYISATEASKEAIWLAPLCNEFGLPDKAPMLGCDSQSAICLAKNAMFHARTKHINVRYHFIREVLEDGLITLVKVHTSWCSRLQKIVALSTTEAEYISATEASKEAIWLARLCSKFGLPNKAPMLGCDSQSAICLAKNAMFHAGTKHIDVWYHFIREVLEDGLITLV
ncbi:hypothetical protein L7F22_006901 [Adiantum nelumboides]|nr:hypothetical protein [Adiantum nelumboides]